MQVKVIGERELIRALDAFKWNVRKKVLTRSLRKGGEVFLAAAKANCTSSLIRNAMVLRNVAGGRGNQGLVMVDVGFRKNEKLVSISKSGERYYIPTAFEYSHVAPYARIPKGQFAGSVRRKHDASKKDKKVAKPADFIGRAFRNSKERAQQAVIDDMAAGMAELQGAS